MEGGVSQADLGHSCTHCSVSFSTQSNPATAMNVDCDLWSFWGYSGTECVCTCVRVCTCINVLGKMSPHMGPRTIFLVFMI